MKNYYKLQDTEKKYYKNSKIYFLEFLHRNEDHDFISRNFFKNLTVELFIIWRVF